MKILLMGSGNRAKAYAAYMGAHIAWVCDPDIEKAERLIREYDLKNARALDSGPFDDGVDGIIIAVPDYLHLEVFREAAAYDVPILLEKPVEVTPGSLASLHKFGTGYGAGIILGFTLRYTFMYSKILELLNDDAVGEIVSVEASETLDPVHAAKFFRRWHRFERNSGGFINTKCSHDMDMLNMIIPGMPVKAVSFGSNSIFSKNRGNAVCSKDCDEYNYCKYRDDSNYLFSTADTSICPYTVESDIVDHQVAAFEFDSGVTAVFTVSMHSDKGDRHIRIHGSEGSITASFSDQVVYLRKPEGEVIAFEPKDTVGSHGGGDKVLCDRFADCIKKKDGENQLPDGITASAMALAAEQSRKTGKVTDMRLFADYIYPEK